MTTEQKLEILERAIEEGAVVEISYYGAEKFTKEKALEKVEKLGTVQEIESDGSTWLTSGDYGFGMTVFYKKAKEDRKKQLLAELAELEAAE
ncbi:hypothetical protein [Psychrobacillus sp.]|uniref:hypothetical protein n=1 Tax=Psychrobacillus sp. TaxID=1871623 RepID=UPI0028BDC666|nr:hypothetical protein [Psychrobacillus sp.]